ncbi:MFS transporter [Nocardia speluncae]|uniref:MFS transporter n=1 Tax=Nocardia speluncae TaxID=419477 RepID=A0A846XAJ0_9NOCA|nr:MFS transporter [Nocardia speluncae]NKY32467.1 MFS transporter [Nocardia speluncae]
MKSNTARDPRRWLILAALCLSLLVLMIDSTVLNIAIPSLIRELDATPADIQWILDSYVLVFAGLLLTAGSLSDRFGRRRMLILGLVVLAMGSLAAVVATEPWQLVAARAVMGLGGALLMPSTLSILMTTFDETERRMALAAWSTVSILGIVAGPVLGGLLLEHYWWGSVFLLNIPVAVLAIVAALVLMPETTGDQRRIDLVGVVLSVVALGSTVYLIIEREWNIAGLALAAGSAVAFVLWERRQEHPMLPLGLFANRDFTGTCATVLLMVFGMGAVMLMLTQYLQFVLGYGPMKAGLALLPYALAGAVFNGIGATLGKNLPNKTLIVSGLTVMALAFTILAVGYGYLWVLVSMLAMGIGGGLAGPAAYAAIMNTIPLRHAGVGSALNDTLQQVGMALSIAILGSVLAGVFTAQMPGEAPAAARESIGAAFELGYADVAKTAFTDAVSVGAWVSAGFSLAAALLGLILLRAHPAPVERSEPVAVAD